jgi:hypothetical protein
MRVALQPYSNHCWEHKKCAAIYMALFAIASTSRQQGGIIWRGVFGLRSLDGSRLLISTKACVYQPKGEKGVRASMTSPEIANKFLAAFKNFSNLAPNESRDLFHRETKPRSRHSGPRPEKQIPIAHLLVSA